MLSAVEFEAADTVPVKVEEIVYGGPIKLLLTYKNGDCVELEFGVSDFWFVDSPEVTYDTLDVNIAEQVKSCFELKNL